MYGADIEGCSQPFWRHKGGPSVNILQIMFCWLSQEDSWTYADYSTLELILKAANSPFWRHKEGTSTVESS